jgi:hypothetical protein
LKSLRITPLQFDILDLRVEKNKNSEGRGTNRALFLFGAGLMAKAKAKKRAGTKPAGTKRGPRITGIAKKPEEMQSARNQVVNLIVDSSVEMTQRVVRSVSERGSVQALRFLWEVAGMFPTAPGSEDGNEEASAKALLEKLGLYGELPAGEADPEGDVESEESQPEE